MIATYPRIEQLLFPYRYWNIFQSGVKMVVGRRVDSAEESETLPDHVS